MKRYLLPIIAILLVISAALAIPTLAADEERSAIDSVTLVREKDSYRIDIKATITQTDIAILSGETVYLFELFPYQSASRLSEVAPVAQNAASASMSFTLTYESGSERLYSKFLIARKMADGNYAILTGARYIDNPEAIASETYDYPTYSSKKGLAVQLYGDAQELGVAQTVINVPLNDYIQTSKSTDSMQYTYGNATYYVSRSKIEYLDYRIKLLTEAGTHCYLNLMLTAPDASLPDGLDCMYFTQDASTGASLYAINTTNQQSVLYYESFVNFLAKRYTMQGGEYGFAGSFIVGYQVNSNRSYNYMGSLSLDSYINYYTVAFRIADTALRSAYSNGRAYISLAGNFNTIAMDSTATVFDTNLDYTARDTLELFASKIKFAGDIPWRLAISARPSDVISTDFTADSLAIDSFDTSYISMNNIDTLCSYMASQNLLYNGVKRGITVSSFGISADNESTALLTQAAMYALAYYKVLFNDDIEALIYYRHVDNANESGNFGLWTADVNKTLYPSAQKSIYSVFKYIDTDKSLETSAFALRQLNIDSWSALIPNFDETKLVCRHVIEQTGVSAETVERFGSGSVLFDFSKGSMCGFTPSDNSDYIELRTDANNEGKYLLYAKGHYEYSSEYMGVGIDFDEPMSVKGGEKLSFTINPTAPDNGTTVDVMLRIYANGTSETPSVVYEGIQSAVLPSIMSTVGFDISQLVEKTQTIDGIRIWIRPAVGSTVEGEYGFLLGSVSMYGSGGASLVKIAQWVGLIILSAAVLILIYAIVMRSVNGSHKRSRRGRRPNAGSGIERPIYSMPQSTVGGQRMQMPGTAPRQSAQQSGQRMQDSSVPRQQNSSATRQQNSSATRQTTPQQNVPRQSTATQDNTPPRRTATTQQNLPRETNRNQ